jgi:hypothetical protein
MGADTGFRSAQFGLPGRYAVTVECADDLTDDEIIMMEAWFETKISLLQKEKRGYTEEQALQWECEALGIDQGHAAGRMMPATRGGTGADA